MKRFGKFVQKRLEYMRIRKRFGRFARVSRDGCESES